MLGDFKRRHGAIERRFTPAERRMLENLARGVRETLSAADEPAHLEDPVLRRLLPATYPDDADAEAEFAAATRTRLVDAKREAADQFVADLAAAPNGLVRLDPAAADRWLRALGDIRLSLAERVGIEEVQRSVRSPHGMTYAWLTWLQGSLVDALAAG